MMPPKPSAARARSSLTVTVTPLSTSRRAASARSSGWRLLAGSLDRSRARLVARARISPLVMAASRSGSMSGMDQGGHRPPGTAGAAQRDRGGAAQRLGVDLVALAEADQEQLRGWQAPEGRQHHRLLGLALETARLQQQLVWRAEGGQRLAGAGTEVAAGEHRDDQQVGVGAEGIGVGNCDLDHRSSTWARAAGEPSARQRGGRAGAGASAPHSLVWPASIGAPRSRPVRRSATDAASTVGTGRAADRAGRTVDAA